MPELAEVETARRRIEKALKGKKIVRAEAVRGDRTVFDRQSPEQVEKALVGARVTGSGRVGKYMWIELDRRPWPVLHLGMTGDIEIRDARGRKIGGWGALDPSLKRVHGKVRKKKDAVEDKPRFWRLQLVAADGTRVAMTDPRRFGRIRLANSPRDEAPIAGLGYDPVTNPPSLSVMKETLAKRRIPIKTVLLDQGIFAGVGNWIADEVLYQAKISPHRPSNALSGAEVGRLRAKILGVIRKAVAVDADSGKFPKSWLFHRRWSKGRKPGEGEKLVFDTIGGRTAAWSPSRQK